VKNAPAALRARSSQYRHLMGRHLMGRHLMGRHLMAPLGAAGALGMPEEPEACGKPPEAAMSRTGGAATDRPGGHTVTKAVPRQRQPPAPQVPNPAPGPQSWSWLASSKGRAGSAFERESGGTVPGPLGGYRIVRLTATISAPLAMILAGQDADLRGVTRPAPLLPRPSPAPARCRGASPARIPTVPWTHRTQG